MTWAAFVPVMQWVGEKLGSAIAAKVFGDLMDKLIGDNGMTLEDFYARMIQDFSQIIGAAIEAKNIEEIQTRVRAWQHDLNNIIGGNPTDINNDLDRARSKGVDLWHFALRYKRSTIPALMTTTSLLFVVYKELERVEPAMKNRHRLSAIELYYRFKNGFNVDELFENKWRHDAGQVPVHMDEKTVIVGYRHDDGGRLRGEPRSHPIYEGRYNHWFIWEGKRYDAGEQRDRNLSHNLGHGLRDKTIRECESNQKFKQSLKEAKGAFDFYYNALFSLLERETPKTTFDLIKTQVGRYQTGNYSLLPGLTSPLSSSPSSFFTSTREVPEETTAPPALSSGASGVG